MKPFSLRTHSWLYNLGTNHISKARGIDEDYGTWWEVSAHLLFKQNCWNNKTLMEMIQENPDEY